MDTIADSDDGAEAMSTGGEPLRHTRSRYKRRSPKAQKRRSSSRTAMARFRRKALDTAEEVMKNTRALPPASRPAVMIERVNREAGELILRRAVPLSPPHLSSEPGEFSLAARICPKNRRQHDEAIKALEQPVNEQGQPSLLLPEHDDGSVDMNVDTLEESAMGRSGDTNRAGLQEVAHAARIVAESERVGSGDEMSVDVKPAEEKMGREQAEDAVLRVTAQSGDDSGSCEDYVNGFKIVSRLHLEDEESLDDGSSTGEASASQNILPRECKLSFLPCVVELVCLCRWPQEED